MAGRGKSKGSPGGYGSRSAATSSKGASRSANLGTRSRSGRGKMGGFDPSAAPAGIGKNTGKGKNVKGKPQGGPTATAANAPEGSLRVMRKSTWDRMSAGVKMREYNTTSYTKYKASQTRGKTSAREMKQQ